METLVCSLKTPVPHCASRETNDQRPGEILEIASEQTNDERRTSHPSTEQTPSPPAPWGPTTKGSPTAKGRDPDRGTGKMGDRWPGSQSSFVTTIIPIILIIIIITTTPSAPGLAITKIINHSTHKLQKKIISSRVQASAVRDVQMKNTMR